MTTTKNNEHKKLNFSSEREQNQACLNSAEHEKNQGRKVLNVPNKQEQNQTCSDSAEREGLSPKGNVPNLRFKEFQGEWEKCKLGDLTAKVGSGSTPKGGNAVYTSAGHCFVRSQNVGMGYLILDDVAHINDGIHQKHKATELKEDDVLLNITGASIGRTAIATKEIEGGNVNQHVCIIRANSKVSPKFLCNYIQTKKIQNYIQSLQTGGSREGLNFEQIRSFPISLPNMAEQNKIAQLLDKLNERIATQNKIIEDLKKLKSAIIEIEYTPNTKTTSHIGNVIEQISKRNKNNAIQNVLSVSNRQGFIKQSDQFENRNVASEDTSNYKIVEKNDFAFNPARINVGSIARLTTFEKGIVSPMYICFRTQENVAPEYIDFFFESKHFYCEIQKRLEGSVRQCLSFEGLCNIPFSLPSLEMQQRIGKRLFILGQKIKTETDLLELLNKQKYYLLRQMFI